MNPDLERRVAEIEGLLAQLIKSDRYIFQRTLQLLDGRNIQLASGTGSMIGTANSQKLGFFGGTPRVQATADTINNATNLYSTAFFADATYSNNEVNMLNNIWNCLIGNGLIREI